MTITIEAQRQMDDKFRLSPYIGHAQIYDEAETGLGKHKFYYLGFHDVFGVEIPAHGRRRGVEYQIWSDVWVRKHLPRLDHLIREARAGKYVHVRHNIQLAKRAKQYGRQLFSKPRWNSKEKKKAATPKEGALPIRGRKKKRSRRQLL